MRRVSIQALLGPAFVLYLIADAASAEGALDRVGWLVGALALGLSLLRSWAARDNEGSGGRRAGFLVLALGLSLVRVAVPGALSLTVDLTHALSLSLAGALLVDLALSVPDPFGGRSRKRQRACVYSAAGAVGLWAAAAHGPPLVLAGLVVVLPQDGVHAPSVLWLTALGVSLSLRLLRLRTGSSPEALASNAWGLLGLAPALAIALGALVFYGLGAEPTAAPQRVAFALIAGCVAASHIKLVDPRERLRVGRAARDLIAAGLTLGAVGAAAYVVVPLLPRAPLSLSVGAIAMLLLSLALFLSLRQAAERALSPFGGRLITALEQSHGELPGVTSLSQVGGVVLRACRAASGDASAKPLLFVSQPALQLSIDLAGQPHLERGALRGPLLERLQAEPGEIVLRGPLEQQRVRMPSLRPLIEQLAALDALCVLPLLDNAELEGALIVPRGLRRSALTLEELDALQRFGRHVTGLVAVLAAQERAAERAAESFLSLARSRDEVAALTGQVEGLQAQVQALRIAGAQERLGDPLLAYSAPMRRLLDRSARFEAHEALLLEAEAGTPLYPLAQHIHAQARPPDAAFVIADTAGLSPERNSATLFDLEDQQSLWRLARGGTLLLLDLPSLTPDAQWALQQRLSQQRRLDAGSVRVIASTRVAARVLRERGGVLRPLLDAFAQALVVPPLRERPEDLPSAILLAIDRACRQLGRATVGIEPDAQKLLMAHRWPGNLAELTSVIERAADNCTGPRITAADLPALVDAQPKAGPDARHVLDGTLESLERKVLQHAMERARGNKSQAARLLGLPRTTLVDKLRRHGLDDPPSGRPRAAN